MGWSMLFSLPWPRPLRLVWHCRPTLQDCWYCGAHRRLGTLLAALPDWFPVRSRRCTDYTNMSRSRGGGVWDIQSSVKLGTEPDVIHKSCVRTSTTKISALLVNRYHSRQVIFFLPRLGGDHAFKFRSRFGAEKVVTLARNNLASLISGATWSATAHLNNCEAPVFASTSSYLCTAERG